MRLQDDFTTTSGVLALSNLQAQIEGLEARASAGLLSVAEHAGLIELIALRGQIHGRIADYEWAEAEAAELSRSNPDDGMVLMARARSRARFHRFMEALADLDEAQRLGAPRETIESERAGIFQAIGDYERALAYFRAAAERRADFASIGALAVLHAERGDSSVAEQFFEESRNLYRGVSPIPLALVDFQRGLMWMTLRELHRARSWFQAAQRALPGYAAAQGHLAEVDAALGDTEAAIERLQPLTTTSDDPDYSAVFARILSAIGRTKEADAWRDRAAARYDDLVSRHPDAFADHAAEFWLGAGGDPRRALALAKKNLEIRRTPHARKLLMNASRACGVALEDLPTDSSRVVADATRILDGSKETSLARADGMAMGRAS